jgi:hypothetical protein
MLFLILLLLLPFQGLVLQIPKQPVSSIRTIDFSNANNLQTARNCLEKVLNVMQVEVGWTDSCHVNCFSFFFRKGFFLSFSLKKGGIF